MVLGSVQAGADGRWSLEITTDLPSGINSVIARTATRESGIFTVHVELPPEPRFAITTAIDNVGDHRPTFYGSGAAGQLVTLYSGNLVLGSVQAGTDGRWNLEITTDLPNGINSVIARTATRESGIFTVHVDLPIEKPLAINLAYDNVGERGEYLFNNPGEKTDDTRPRFHGTAGSIQIVTLYAGETVLGSVQADRQGAWSLEINVDLAEGSNVIVGRTATQQSGEFVINVETKPAEPVLPVNPEPVNPVVPGPGGKPVITQVIDSFTREPLENSGIAESAPVFSGIADPFAEITLYFASPVISLTH